MSSYSSADDEYDSDEPPQLKVDFDKLMRVATDTLHTRCVSAKRMTRGSRHEIFVLKFEANDATVHKSLVQSDYSCIARFARVKGSTAKEDSEIATIRYLKKHTDIPVPEIYYQDLDPENEIGAAFVLMQRLPGRHLYKSWDSLSLEHKKVALSEIASVIAKLSSLHFDEIGCLQEGGIGPVISPCYEPPRGPFSSTLEYLLSFVRSDSVGSQEREELFQEIGAELSRCVSQKNSLYLKSPFRMIHADFDAQNMLFLDASDGSGPTLSGIIDFEYSYVGPAYFLYEYPIFIQDVNWSKELYAENSILRAHFVAQIHSYLPNQKEQEIFIACMNSKSYLLNSFRNSFMLIERCQKTLVEPMTHFLKDLKDGTGLAYSGRLDYIPEYYSESAQPLRSLNGARSEPE